MIARLTVFISITLVVWFTPYAVVTFAITIAGVYTVKLGNS